MSNAMTSIITADEGVLYTSHRKISPDNLIKQWMKAETLLSFITLTSTMTIHSVLRINVTTVREPQVYLLQVTSLE